MAKSQHAQRYREIPGLLRRMRQAAAMTQRELAKRLRVSHVHIHKSETGSRRVDIAEFVDWCRACDVDPQEGFVQLLKLRQV